jgi:hypothetical protein
VSKSGDDQGSRDRISSGAGGDDGVDDLALAAGAHVPGREPLGQVQAAMMASATELRDRTPGLNQVQRPGQSPRVDARQGQGRRWIRTVRPAGR